MHSFQFVGQIAEYRVIPYHTAVFQNRTNSREKYVSKVSAETFPRRNTRERRTIWKPWRHFKEFASLILDCFEELNPTLCAIVPFLLRDYQLSKVATAMFFFFVLA